MNPFPPPAPETKPPVDAAIDQTTGECVRSAAGAFLTRNELLTLWDTAKKQLDSWKEAETALRAQVVAVFTDPKKDKGTENIEIGAGWKLKVVKDINYKFISRDEAFAVFDVVADAQARIANLELQGRDATFMEAVSDQLVKWQPELSVSAYTKMPDDVRVAVHAIINECIETKPASPQVKLEPPKDQQ